MSAKAIAKAILSALGEGGVHHISLPPEEIRILCEAVLAPRPEAGATAYENLRQRCLRLGDFHPSTKGSIGDIWAEIYKVRAIRQPAAELAVGYLAEFIDNYFAESSKPQEER